MSLERRLINQLKMFKEEYARIELKLTLLLKQKHALEEKMGKMQRDILELGRERVMKLKERERVAEPGTLEQLVLSKYGKKGLQALDLMRQEGRL